MNNRSLPILIFLLAAFCCSLTLGAAPEVQPLFVKLGLKEAAAELPENGFLGDRTWEPSISPAFQRVLEIRKTLPVEDRLVPTGKSVWIGWPKGEWSVNQLNAALGTQFETLEKVPFLLKKLRTEFFEKGVPICWNGVLSEMRHAKFLGSDREWEALPVAEFDYWKFQKNPLRTFVNSISDNYRLVPFYLFTKGRAAVKTILNTSIGSTRFMEGKYHSFSEKWDYCP